jgi:ParB-like chromosome segregation protein Spo0J
MPSATDRAISACQKAVSEAADPIAAISLIRKALHQLCPVASQPVDFVQWVPLEEVIANDYNPNSVAPNEMKLLYTSILHDGYTQPVVTIRDEERGKYIIVDGFHRYSTMRLHQDIKDRTAGLVPVVVLDKPINDRMASTVRHNRARGKHAVTGMASMVYSMLDNGWTEAAICNELGMEPDELIRLKHITGFSRLFENVEYRQAWEARKQSILRREWREANGNNPSSN